MGQDMNKYLAEKAQLIMQLRAQSIRNPEVLSTLERVPREQFLPASLRKHAYEDASLPIAGGQTISQPYIVARMTEALQLNRRHIVLEIGTGSGYQAAILSHLARRVYTIERLRPLLVQAENRFRELHLTNITALHGDGHRGWPEAAPFDRIMVTCRSEELPTLLFAQLKEGGILIAPIGSSGQEVLFRVTKENGEPVMEQLMPVRFVPMIMGTGHEA